MNSMYLLKKISTKSLTALSGLIILPAITLACENGILCSVPDCPNKASSPSLSTSQSTPESNPNPAKRARVVCPSPSVEPSTRDRFPLISQNSDLMAELLEFLTQEEILNGLKLTSKTLCASAENCQPKVIKRTQRQEHVKFKSFAEYFLRTAKNQIYSPNFTISFKCPKDVINFSNDQKAQSTAKKITFVWTGTSMPKDSLNGFKKFKKLRSLKFDWLDLDSSNTIIPLIAELKNLEDLSLSSHFIDEGTGSNLISALKHLESFRKLDLTGTHFNCRTGRDIIPLISSFQSFSFIIPQYTSDPDIATLASEIEKSKSLKELRMFVGNGRVTFQMDAELAPLFSAIGKSTSLEALDLGLSDYDFDDDQAELAAESIKNSKTLKKVQFRTASFEDRGAIAFASAIEASPSLESLIFSRGFVKMEGTKHLARAVQNSKMLKYFRLGYAETYGNTKMVRATWEGVKLNRPDIDICIHNNKRALSTW